MFISVLILLLAHPHYAVRQAAHDGLIELAEPRDLLPFLDHHDPEVRWRVDLLISQTGWKELRLLFASLRGLPYIDADPCWSSSSRFQPYLSRAMSRFHERGWKVGAPEYPEYRLASQLAMEDGMLTDPWRLAWMLERTAVYGECRAWTRPK